jgi:uncharacterized protein
MPRELKTDRTRVRRQAARGRYDPAEIHAILDEALICHVGFVQDGQPFVIPTIHARVEDTLYVHGSVGSRLIQAAGSGASLCVTVTIVDGVVLARSVFNHSMNYRSAVVIGRGRAVVDPGEKLRALRAVADHMVPGRWGDARPPNAKELEATGVTALAITEASAKIRTGPPEDDDEDLALRVWAGVLPLRLAAGEPVRDPGLAADIRLPPYLESWRTR